MMHGRLSRRHRFTAFLSALMMCWLSACTAYRGPGAQTLSTDQQRQANVETLASVRRDGPIFVELTSGEVFRAWYTSHDDVSMVCQKAGTEEPDVRYLFSEVSHVERVGVSWLRTAGAVVLGAAVVTAIAALSGFKRLGESN